MASQFCSQSIHILPNEQLQQVEKTLCVFVFPVTGKWRKEKTQSHCKGTSENAALLRDVTICGKQRNSFLKAFFLLLKALLPSWKVYPCQSVANLVKGKKRLGSDRFDNLSDAWCSALLLIGSLSNIKPLFLHRGAQLDARKPQPRKIARLVSCQDPCFVPYSHVLDSAFVI